MSTIEIEPFLTNVQTIQRCRFTRIDTLDRLKFHETLDAAGLTYVAALAVTMIQLLQLLTILGGNRRD